MQISEDYFNNDEFKRNLKSYEESVKSGRPIFMDVDDLADILDYYNFNQRKDKADEVAEYILSIYPGATAPIVYKTRKALDNDDFALAEELVEQVADTSDPDYLYLKAEIKIAAKDYSKAQEILLDGFNHVEAEESESFILDAANLYCDYEVYDWALHWLEWAKNKHTSDFQSMYLKSLVSTQQLKKAKAFAEEEIDRQPYNFQLWNYLSTIQYLMMDFNEAITSCEYSLAIAPDNPSGLWSKALVYIALENFEAALECLRRYNRDFPEKCPCLLAMANCFFKLGNSDSGMQMIEKAEALHQPPMYTETVTYEELANELLDINQYGKALLYARYAISTRYPEDPSSLYVIEANALIGLHREEEGRESILKAEKSPSVPAEIKCKIIYLMYQRGHFEEAYARFQQYKADGFKLLSPIAPFMSLCCMILGNEESTELFDLAAIACPDFLRDVMREHFNEDLSLNGYRKRIIEETNRNRNEKK